MNDRPVVFVTGASRGIGRATAIEFARRGYDVTIVARSLDDLDETARLVGEVGGDAIVCAGDLADLEFAERAVRETVERWGRIDVLVNNAAWREIVSMRDISVESWERTLRVSLTAPAFLARWAAEAMRSRGGGVIVNVSSMMSSQAAGFAPAYIAAKGGLDSLTYELATTYAPDGIRVVTVNPGAIDTEMSRDLTEDESAHDEVRRYTEDMIMLGRWGTAEEIARLICSLASDDFAYVTGTTITADGGWSRAHLPASLKSQNARE